MITVQELEARAKEIAELRGKCDLKRAELKEMDSVLSDLETSFIAALEETGKASYDSEYGRLTITSRSSVKVPKDIEDKKALFSWLQDQGIYFETVSVNSQTVNKLFKEYSEKAEAEGQLFFRLPGCNEVTVSQTLSFRKK